MNQFEEFIVRELNNRIHGDFKSLDEIINNGDADEILPIIVGTIDNFNQRLNILEGRINE